MDSKYFHNPDQLDKDIEAKIKYSEAITEEVYNYLDKLILDNPAKADITFRCIIKTLAVNLRIKSV